MFRWEVRFTNSSLIYLPLITMATTHDSHCTLDHTWRVGPPVLGYDDRDSAGNGLLKGNKRCHHVGGGERRHPPGRSVVYDNVQNKERRKICDTCIPSRRSITHGGNWL